jgi:hypothetical protein
MGRDHGEGVVVDGLRVTALSWRGLQECPYGCPHAGEDRHVLIPFNYASHDFCIEDVRGDRRIDFPGLIIHLVREHGFFEGAVSYRLEPRAAIEILGLEPGVNYAPKYASESCWRSCFSSGSPYEQELERYGRIHDLQLDDVREVIDVAPGVRVNVKPTRLILTAERDHLLVETLRVDGLPILDRRLTKGTALYVRGIDTYVL